MNQIQFDLTAVDLGASQKLTAFNAMIEKIAASAGTSSVMLAEIFRGAGINIDAATVKATAFGQQVNAAIATLGLSQESAAAAIATTNRAIDAQAAKYVAAGQAAVAGAQEQIDKNAVLLKNEQELTRIRTHSHNQQMAQIEARKQAQHAEYVEGLRQAQYRAAQEQHWQRANIQAVTPSAVEKNARAVQMARGGAANTGMFIADNAAYENERALRMANKAATERAIAEGRAANTQYANIQAVTPSAVEKNERAVRAANFIRADDDFLARERAARMANERSNFGRGIALAGAAAYNEELGAQGAIGRSEARPDVWRHRVYSPMVGTPYGRDLFDADMALVPGEERARRQGQYARDIMMRDITQVPAKELYGRMNAQPYSGLSMAGQRYAGKFSEDEILGRGALGGKGAASAAGLGLNAVEKEAGVLSRTFSKLRVPHWLQGLAMYGGVPLYSGGGAGALVAGGAVVGGAVIAASKSSQAGYEDAQTAFSNMRKDLDSLGENAGRSAQIGREVLRKSIAWAQTPEAVAETQFNIESGMSEPNFNERQRKATEATVYKWSRDITNAPLKNIADLFTTGVNAIPERFGNFQENPEDTLRKMGNVFFKTQAMGKFSTEDMSKSFPMFLSTASQMKYDPIEVFAAVAAASAQESEYANRTKVATSTRNIMSILREKQAKGTLKSKGSFLADVMGDEESQMLLTESGAIGRRNLSVWSSMLQAQARGHLNAYYEEIKKAFESSLDIVGEQGKKRRASDPENRYAMMKDTFAAQAENATLLAPRDPAMANLELIYEAFRANKLRETPSAHQWLAKITALVQYDLDYLTGGVGNAAPGMTAGALRGMTEAEKFARESGNITKADDLAASIKALKAGKAVQPEMATNSPVTGWNYIPRLLKAVTKEYLHGVNTPGFVDTPKDEQPLEPAKGLLGKLFPGVFKEGRPSKDRHISPLEQLRNDVLETKRGKHVSQIEEDVVAGKGMSIGTLRGMFGGGFDEKKALQGDFQEEQYVAPEKFNEAQMRTLMQRYKTKDTEKAIGAFKTQHRADFDARQEQRRSEYKKSMVSEDAFDAVKGLFTGGKEDKKGPADKIVQSESIIDRFIAALDRFSKLEPPSGKGGSNTPVSTTADTPRPSRRPTPPRPVAVTSGG